MAHEGIKELLSDQTENTRKSLRFHATGREFNGEQGKFGKNSELAAASKDFVEQSGVLPFKVDSSSILQSNGGELGSTGLVISPLVQSGWLDQCNAVERSSPFVLPESDHW